MQSSFNLAAFEQHVVDAQTSEYSERFVRIMLGKVATNCPMDVLVKLGKCIADCRREELSKEVETN